MRLAFLILFVSLFLSGCLTNGSNNFNNYSDYVLDINKKKINDYEREQELIKSGDFGFINFNGDSMFNIIIR